MNREERADFAGVQISHATLLDQLTERIEQQIHTGELALGQRLPSEGAVAETYGVSRPVVREALARLRARGYIRTATGTGTFVRHPDAADLAEAVTRLTSLSSAHPITADDLYAARGSIEVLAARTAAERRTAEDCERLAAHVATIEASVGDPSDFAAANAGYHLAIAEASHNPLLPTLLSLLLSMIADGMMRSHSSQQAVEVGMRDHHSILDRIRASDADGAAEAMEAHLHRSRAHYAGQ